MIFREITLEHREAVEQLYRRWGHQDSAHSFQSLFLWQEEMRLSLWLEPELYCVRSAWRGENDWFFPCGEPNAVEEFVRRRMEETGAPLRFLYVCAEDAAFLEANFPGAFQLCHMPDDDEYLYDKGEQLALQGKKFRHQRGAVNRIGQSSSVTVRMVDADTMNDAWSILSQSHDLQSSAANTLTSCSADRMLIANWDALGMFGVIVYENGVPAALTAGYFLSEECFDISTSRQVLDQVSLAVYARHRLFGALPAGVDTINAEEDLGMEGLRQLKLGMRPSRIQTMYEGKCVCGKNTQRL